MGTYGQKLVGDKKDKILELLNKALADEWYAHYQYWIGAKIIKRPDEGCHCSRTYSTRH